MNRLALLFIPALLFGQIDQLTGSYRLDPSISEDPFAAVQNGTASMNFLTRPIARKLLAKHNYAAKELLIASDKDRLKIESSVTPNFPIPYNGQTVNWTLNDGETVTVSRKWAGSYLEELIKSKDGDRTNRYEWDAKREVLIWKVRLSSPRLPKAIEYQIAYRRIE